MPIKWLQERSEMTPVPKMAPTKGELVPGNKAEKVREKGGRLRVPVRTRTGYEFSGALEFGHLNLVEYFLPGSQANGGQLRVLVTEIPNGRWADLVYRRIHFESGTGLG